MREPKQLGDFRKGVAIGMVEDEDRPLADRQLFDQFVKPDVARSLPARDELAKTIDEPALAAVTAHTLAQRDGRQPGLDGVRVSQRVDLAAREDVGIMDDVLGRIPSQAPANADETWPKRDEAIVQLSQPLVSVTL